MAKHQHILLRPLRTSLAAVSEIYQFIRFPVLNFSVILPLLGAVTATARLTDDQILGLVAVGVAFHIFAYVLNDVIDLPIDLTEPLRQESPLVRGIIRPRHALVFALAQIPLAILCTVWLRGGALAYITLVAGFATMTVYDLWGKRLSFPPLTDAIQGVGWAALAFYGVAVVGRPPTSLTAALLTYVFVLVLMLNGVHGALRDLKNDLQCGARTTAILLGAYPKSDLEIRLPTRLRFYALVLQALLLGSSLVPLLGNWYGYESKAWRVTTALELLITAAILYCFVRAMKSVGDRWNMIFFGILHLFLLLGFLVAPFLYRVDGVLRVVLLTVYLVPILAMWLRYGFKWG
jgi:4-hydroxybenzoate polyprenyltransferase